MGSSPLKTEDAGKGEGREHEGEVGGGGQVVAELELDGVGKHIEAHRLEFVEKERV